MPEGARQQDVARSQRSLDRTLAIPAGLPGADKLNQISLRFEILQAIPTLKNGYQWSNSGEFFYSYKLTTLPMKRPVAFIAPCGNRADCFTILS